MYENSHAWGLKTPRGYEIRLYRIYYSVTDSTYRPVQDGLSIVMARCDYIAKAYADIPIHSPEWSEQLRRIMVFDNGPVPETGITRATMRSLRHAYRRKAQTISFSGRVKRFR